MIDKNTLKNIAIILGAISGITLLLSLLSRAGAGNGNGSDVRKGIVTDAYDDGSDIIMSTYNTSNTPITQIVFRVIRPNGTSTRLYTINNTTSSSALGLSSKLNLNLKLNKDYLTTLS